MVGLKTESVMRAIGYSKKSKLHKKPKSKELNDNEYVPLSTQEEWLNPSHKITLSDEDWDQIMHDINNPLASKRST